MLGAAFPLTLSSPGEALPAGEPELSRGRIQEDEAAPRLPHPHPWGTESRAAARALHAQPGAGTSQGGGRTPGLWWLDGLPGAVGNSKRRAGPAASPIPPALLLSPRLQDAVCPLECLAV